MDIRASDYDDFKMVKSAVKKMNSNAVVGEQLRRLSRDVTRRRCRQCHKFYGGGPDRGAIIETGYCLGCLNILSDHENSEDRKS